MMDPWDYSPTLPPYFGGGFEELSPEQMAEEQAAYKRYCKERMAEWRRERPEMVQERLNLLRRYQERRGPNAAVCQRGRVRPLYPAQHLRLPDAMPVDHTRKDPVNLFGYGNVFKIGHTDDLDRRTTEHRRPPECGGLDPLIEHHTIYYTPIDRRVLESLLLHHYKDFRCRRDLNEELFSLPQEEADGFEAVAKAIEQHLLAVEYLRLDATLARLKAECR